MVGLDGALQSGRLDQPRSSFNGAPIMIIHADDGGTMLMVLMVVLLKMLVVRWPNEIGR